MPLADTAQGTLFIENGGGGGSRTHVFLPLRRNFYMRSFIIDLDRVWG